MTLLVVVLWLLAFAGGWVLGYYVLGRLLVHPPKRRGR